jgi:hypothetical protein
MANTKISALTSATTPLAGTETLPVVQSSATTKVTVANLTVGRSVSASNFIPSDSTVPTNGMYLPAANSVGIATNTTSAIRIDSSQNVGLGSTTTSGGRLVISQSNASQPAIYFPTDETTIQGPGTNTFIKMGGNLILQSGNQTTITAKNASGVIVFQTGATPTETSRIDSNSNYVVSIAGKGINFTANTPAAGMTTQLLNWYEEGTWTPTVTFATPGDLAVTYNTNQRQGIYTRTGNRIIVNFLVGTSSFTFTTSSGVLQITGLPFTAKTDVGIQNIGSVIWGGITKVGYTQVTPTIQQAANYIQFVASGSAIVQSNVVSTDVPSGGTVVLRGMVVYEV